MGPIHLPNMSLLPDYSWDTKLLILAFPTTPFHATGFVILTKLVGWVKRCLNASNTTPFEHSVFKRLGSQ